MCMLEPLIVRYGSPTLSGLKTGSLFTCTFSSRCERQDCLLYWNQRLSHKGLYLLPLNECRGRTLIYLYRPSFLARDLSNPKAAALLTRLHYPAHSAACCVAQLMAKLRTNESFPHEIGLFLGYPPEDVQGFMNNPSDCKYAGYWKVYENADAARTLFAQYRLCTRHNQESLAMGAPLETLASSGL